MEKAMIEYHALTALLHLQELADNGKDLDLNDVSRDILYKAIFLMHVWSGGEDARENRSDIDTAIVDV